MSEANQGAANADVQETQEQREARLAAAYRAQSGQGGADDANVDPHARADAPQRPEHIPEKFWDAEKGEVRVEEMAKSYAELEKARAKPAAGEGEGAGDGAGEPDEAAKAAREEFAKYREGVTEKIVSGAALEDADYAPAEKLGLSREDVDTFIAGLKAMGTLHQMKVHEEAGGAENYSSMIAWAKENYSPEEVAAYNRDVHSSDPAVSLNAVRGLSARYQVAEGRTPNVDVTRNGGRAGSDAYASKAEMVKDMQNPQYQKDPAFRAKVASKIAAARAANIDLMQ